MTSKLKEELKTGKIGTVTFFVKSNLITRDHKHLSTRTGI